MTISLAMMNTEMHCPKMNAVIGKSFYDLSDEELQEMKTPTAGIAQSMTVKISLLTGCS